MLNNGTLVQYLTSFRAPLKSSSEKVKNRQILIAYIFSLL